MTVSPEIARIYASAPVDDDYYETLELSHPSFTTDWFLTTQVAGFTATLETGRQVDFLPAPFAVKLPGSNGDGNQQLTISLSNVDRLIVDELERAGDAPQDPINANYRVYAASDLSAPGAVVLNLGISEVSATDTDIAATAARSEVLNRPFPRELYTVAAFPGLDR
jgi:uncharacterized protein DUF1833